MVWLQHKTDEDDADGVAVTAAAAVDVAGFWNVGYECHENQLNFDCIFIITIIMYYPCSHPNPPPYPTSSQAIVVSGRSITGLKTCTSWTANPSLSTLSVSDHLTSPSALSFDKHFC